MFNRTKTQVFTIGNTRPAWLATGNYANPIIPYFMRVVTHDSAIWPALLDLLNYLSEKLFTPAFTLRLGDGELEKEPADEFHIFTPRIKTKYFDGVIRPGVLDWEYRFRRARTLIARYDAVHPGDGATHFVLPLSREEVSAMRGVNVYISVQTKDGDITNINAPLYSEIYSLLRNGFYWADLKEELAYRTGNTGVQG